MKRNRGKKVMITAAAALALFFSPLSARVIDGLFININGNAVTYSEFREFVANRLAITEGDAEEFLRREHSREELKGLTDAFIDVKLIQFELSKLGESVKDEEIGEVIDRIMAQNGFTEEEFEKTLEREGITIGAYRDKLKHEMEKGRIIRALKGKEVLVTDAEAKNFYLENRKRFKKNYSVSISMLSFPIFLSAEKEEIIRFREVVNEADSLVAEGASLKEVEAFLQTRGFDPSTSEAGPIPVEDLSREVKMGIARLSVGETSPSTIVKDKVIYVTLKERIGGEYMPFEEVHGQIKEELVGNRSIGAIKEIIQELRGGSYIEVHL